MLIIEFIEIKHIKSVMPPTDFERRIVSVAHVAVPVYPEEVPLCLQQER